MENMRIKANLDADTTNIIVNLNQDFSNLEILSLKLTSEDIYKLHNSDFGVLTGRVITNGGFGIPNARVSIFIASDKNDSGLIKSFYPYESPYDKNDGIRYNLLPKEKQNDLHVPVGTFPEKNELLDNEVWIEVYDKYYKYNAITNASGDYMIIGVPTGNQVIHMDVDLSDIGYVSLRPFDLISQGFSKKMFDGNNKFKASKDLQSLPQLQNVVTTTNIIPFWGDRSTNQIGITQLNFNLPVNITPNALFFGGIFTDGESGKISKTCRVRDRSGDNCKIEPVSGFLELVRLSSDFSNTIEYFPINTEIDEEGNYIALIPMNLEKMITDEFGNLVKSNNPNIGIPTRTKVRFKFNTQNYSYKFFRGFTQTGNFLVPNLYNRFEFGSNTHVDDLFELKWKKTYTVRQYIPRFTKNKNLDKLDNLGIKQIDDCNSEINAFPYNRMAFNLNPIYVLATIIVSVFVFLINAINAIPILSNIKLVCNDEELEPNQWKDCILQRIADILPVSNFMFYNDWVTGSLYAPKFEYKVKYKNGTKRFERYCDFDCRSKVNSNPDDLNYKNKCKKTYITEDTQFLENNSNPLVEVGRGLIVKYDNNFYYAARHDIEKNSTLTSDNLSLSVDEKKYLLLATNIVETGSMSDCDIDNIPFIVKNLESSTYKAELEGDILFNVETVIASSVQNRKALQHISQTQIEQQSTFYDYLLMGNFEDLPEYDSNTNGKTNFVALNRTNTDIRKYLCESQKYFNNVFLYSSTTVDNLNSLSYVVEYDEEDNTTELAEFTYDECNCINSNETTNKLYNKMFPYYLFFGYKKNKTSLNTIIKDYF